MSNKIVDLKKLKKIISLERKNKKKIAFTNGCFDILHYGHIKYLNQAKRLADILIVGVNTDASIKKIKGYNRPINPLKHRMAVLASLSCVDYVISFSQKTPYSLIRVIKPDLLIKGADWKGKKIVGSDIVKRYNGKVITLPYIKGVSTTEIIKRITKRFGR